MADLVKARASKRAVRRAGDGGRRIEYLAFVLAGETYAVQIAHVAEILRPPPITEVPRAPRTVLGVISVRGKVTFHIHADGHQFVETGSKVQLPTEATLDGAPVVDYQSSDSPSHGSYTCSSHSYTTTTASGVQTDSWSR